MPGAVMQDTPGTQIRPKIVAPPCQSL
jgi:hypothetical protein